MKKTYFFLGLLSSLSFAPFYLFPILIISLGKLYNLIKLDNISIIDSPGFTNKTTIYNPEEFDLIKRVMPRTFLKPTTYQVKPISSILIEDKIRLQSSINNSLTFYISNAINVERVFDNNTSLQDKPTITLDIPDNSDLVIKSLGFINIKKSCKLTIYTDNKDLFEIRKSMF